MIITRSPLRISLGGGGTDLPSYYRKHSGFLLAAGCRGDKEEPKVERGVAVAAPADSNGRHERDRTACRTTAWSAKRPV